MIEMFDYWVIRYTLNRDCLLLYQLYVVGADHHWCCYIPLQLPITIIECNQTVADTNIRTLQSYFTKCSCRDWFSKPYIDRAWNIILIPCKNRIYTLSRKCYISLPSENIHDITECLPFENRKRVNVWLLLLPS